MSNLSEDDATLRSIFDLDVFIRDIIVKVSFRSFSIVSTLRRATISLLRINDVVNFLQYKAVFNDTRVPGGEYARQVKFGYVLRSISDRNVATPAPKE